MNQFGNIGTGVTCKFSSSGRSSYAFIRSYYLINMVRMFQQTVLFFMEEVVIQITKELFSKENIDGGLIGGASLDK